MARRRKAANLHVCIGITGGIAAYKIPYLVRILRKRQCEVKAVCTPAALSLVGPEALRTVTGNRVYCDNEITDYDMDHIRLAQWADCMLVCPASANTLAKIAHGIADNLLTTLVLAFEKPVLCAPAMNSAMWRKPVTQDNINLCAQRGIRVLGVDEGELACGAKGEGRMLGEETLADYVLGAMHPQILAGRTVLIATGPTVEPIDRVRVITNRSSGKMGAALAREACAMGAKVVVVSGPAPAPLPSSAQCIAVETAAEMSAALRRRFAKADICIMAAAVADFRPAQPLPGKLKRDNARSLHLQLVPNPDIAAQLGRKKKSQILVGFALETTNSIAHARKKMKNKNCDIMVLNRADSALGTDASAVTILQPNASPKKLPTLNKRLVAREILSRASRLAEKQHGPKSNRQR
jgi:phosphopantothenoylcysteine decarboxylase/phosphopantothenate--cysteine ligase